MRAPGEERKPAQDQGGGLGSGASGRIEVPPGRLGAFYWYETDPELFQAERTAMARFFPQFRLQVEADGRLSWVGEVVSNTYPGVTYTLQAVYEHDHPNNDSYGGSIKVYMIKPTLEELAGTAAIPHTLVDSMGQLYICTARPEDFQAARRGTPGKVTTAASSIAWAAKWITAFEMWLEGEITTAQFEGEEV